ncbi:MAG: HypC/HybG/HupF family hydrogenase formation chaperone [Planctomycetota bacterium]
MCLAVPGKVESLFNDRGTRMGKVNFGGVVKDVCLAYLPDVEVGDYTIVHVGFALSKIDEQSAQETLRTFEELGLLEEGLEELRETEYQPGDGANSPDANASNARPHSVGPNSEAPA